MKSTPTEKPFKAQAASALLRRVIGRFVIVFAPAFGIRFWQGWVYFGVVTCAELVAAVYFVRRDVAFAKRRLKCGSAFETRRAQKICIRLLSVFSALMFIVSGIDHRFGWSHIGTLAVLLANAGVLLSIIAIGRVFQENSFASANITVESEQIVISTGPYAMVRHPMYSALIVMQLLAPIALGSWWGLLPAMCSAGVIVLRLLDEEMLLVEQLNGYRAYRESVRYRLAPFVW